MFSDTYSIGSTGHDAAYPTGKRIGFVDGSARAIPRQRLTLPYIYGEGDWWGCIYPGGLPVLHTVDGVRGRDVK